MTAKPQGIAEREGKIETLTFIMLSGPARHYVFGLSVHCIRLFVYPFVCEDRSCYNNVSRTA